ncbi:MAG TPA: hypothetical protein VGQ42_04885 [Candidatus Dormibacteraeota bacterium]|nr:hypothetical protein [Candidatus Dormibacteraeota bacterium]
MTRMIRAAARVLAPLVVAVAVAGCLLPWERLEVTLLGESQVRWVGSFHGSGLVACLGAALLVLMLADRLLRPRQSAIREAAQAFAGTLLVVGAALFTVTGGYAPAGGDGYSVSVQPALPVAGACGAVLLLSAAAMAGWRRAGSRSPASSG